VRTVSASIPLLGIIAALSLYACSSDSGDDPTPPRSAGGAAVTAACSVAAPAPSATPTPPAVDLGTVSGKVGVVLPQTTGLTRPSAADPRSVTRALRDYGVAVEMATPGNRLGFVSSAERMIDHGVKVLIIDPPDMASGAEVEAAAERAGADVIDVDRLTLGGSAQYYVAFDAEAIGRMQAQTLIECLWQQGITDPRVIIMDGGTDVDDGAVLLDKGVHEVLDPLVSAGRVTIAEEAAVKGWRVANAAPAFLVALDASGGQVDGVVAADDGIADGVIGVLARQARNGSVAVTGQGSGIQGLRNIVTGQQSMTVFEDPRAEADAVARLAVTLVSGRRPTAAGLRVEHYADQLSPGRTVEALLLPGQVVTRANVRDVVEGGAVKAADICHGIAEQCAAIGLG
jgi:D-xylose transport system substrate-binding protein